MSGWGGGSSPRPAPRRQRRVSNCVELNEYASLIKIVPPEGVHNTRELSAIFQQLGYDVKDKFLSRFIRHQHKAVDGTPYSFPLTLDDTITIVGLVKSEAATPNSRLRAESPRFPSIASDSSELPVQDALSALAFNKFLLTPATSEAGGSTTAGISPRSMMSERRNSADMAELSAALNKDVAPGNGEDGASFSMVVTDHHHTPNDGAIRPFGDFGSAGAFSQSSAKSGRSTSPAAPLLAVPQRSGRGGGSNRVSRSGSIVSSSGSGAPRSGRTRSDSLGFSSQGSRRSTLTFSDAEAIVTLGLPQPPSPTSLGRPDPAFGPMNTSLGARPGDAALSVARDAQLGHESSLQLINTETDLMSIDDIRHNSVTLMQNRVPVDESMMNSLLLAEARVDDEEEEEAAEREEEDRVARTAAEKRKLLSETGARLSFASAVGPTGSTSSLSRRLTESGSSQALDAASRSPNAAAARRASKRTSEFPTSRNESNDGVTWGELREVLGTIGVQYPIPRAVRPDSALITDSEFSNIVGTIDDLRRMDKFVSTLDAPVEDPFGMGSYERTAADRWLSIKRHMGFDTSASAKGDKTKKKPGSLTDKIRSLTQQANVDPLDKWCELIDKVQQIQVPRDTAESEALWSPSPGRQRPDWVRQRNQNLPARFDRSKNSRQRPRRDSHRPKLPPFRFLKPDNQRKYGQQRDNGRSGKKKQQIESGGAAPVGGNRSDQHSDGPEEEHVVLINEVPAEELGFAPPPGEESDHHHDVSSATDEEDHASRITDVSGVAPLSDDQQQQQQQQQQEQQQTSEPVADTVSCTGGGEVQQDKAAASVTKGTVGETGETGGGTEEEKKHLATTKAQEPEAVQSTGFVTRDAQLEGSQGQVPPAQGPPSPILRSSGGSRRGQRPTGVVFKDDVGSMSRPATTATTRTSEGVIRQDTQPSSKETGHNGSHKDEPATSPERPSTSGAVERGSVGAQSGDAGRPSTAGDATSGGAVAGTRGTRGKELRGTAVVSTKAGPSRGSTGGSLVGSQSMSLVSSPSFGGSALAASPSASGSPSQGFFSAPSSLQKYTTDYSVITAKLGRDFVGDADDQACYWLQGIPGTLHTERDALFQTMLKSEADNKTGAGNNTTTVAGGGSASGLPAKARQEGDDRTVIAANEDDDEVDVGLMPSELMSQALSGTGARVAKNAKHMRLLKSRNQYKQPDLRSRKFASVVKKLLHA